MKYELLLLDFDGTLADTSEAIAACMGHTFTDFGHAPPTLESVRRVIGMSLTRCMQVLHPGLDDAEAELWAERYRHHYSEKGIARTRLYPGVGQALQELHDAGVALAVLSNRTQQVLDACLEQLELAPLMRLSSGDRPERRKKPDPLLYDQEVAPVFPDVALERVLLVGDGEQDTEFALNAGIPCCWAAYGCGHPATCMSHKPRHTIDSFPRLPSLVLGNGRATP